MTNAVVVELTEDDLALAASIVRSHGRDMKQLAIHAQGAQCIKIAEALCNARPQEDVLEES
jgi:hypothetical protein